MNQLETVYLMNVVLYFTTKRTIVHFVQINKKCYDDVKGLHRAPNIDMLSLSSQLRMFPKLQHVSGDLLSFQNIVSLKQLQRISSFENENRKALTPIESIHKAFIGRVKHINITYPFPDLVKFKKLEEIRITFNREYLNKKHSHEKVFLINSKDINEKIRYLRMLKRIILYDVSREMFKKNTEIFGDINPSIQIFIYYDDFIEDSYLDLLPTNVRVITTKITTINPKFICLINNQILPVKASWNSRLDSIAFKFIEKTYYPAFILQSEFKKLIPPPHYSSIETLEIVYDCSELDLKNLQLKHLIVSKINKIKLNSALETLQINGNCSLNIESIERKECLSIIVNASITLIATYVKKICFSGVGMVTLAKCQATSVESNGVFLSCPVWIYNQNLTSLVMKNVRQPSAFQLTGFKLLKNLHIYNRRFRKIYLGNDLDSFIFERSNAEIVNSHFIPTKNIESN
ncbi:F-box domain-containing protein [Entamoeba marina]